MKRLHATGTVTVSTLALALLIVAGCNPTVDRVEPAERMATPATIDDERVLTERGLHQRVQVMSVREATVGGDLLKVEADVENTRRSPQSFVYQFEWFDEEGMRIREGQWRTGRVQGRQMTTISAVADTADAVDFRLHLMRSRN